MTVRPLRLLHVFSTFKVGGAQVRFATLLESFGSLFDNAIIAMDGDYACRERLPPGAPVRFPVADPLKGPTLASILRFRRMLSELKPDRLLTYNWGAIEWALANTPPRIPHIHVEDGFGPEEADRQLARRVWTRRAALAGKTLVVPSRALETLARETWRVPGLTLAFVANGIDLDRYPAAPQPELAARLEAAGTGPVIGTIARLGREKRVDRLIRAVAALDTPIRLAIVGDGPERPALEALADSLGLGARAVFAGYLPDPPAVMATFDVFALSSDTEQMPTSLMEAMAAGLPVVATDVGDVRSMLPPAQGRFLAPPADDAFAHALADLLKATDDWAGLAAGNRAHALGAFDKHAMVERWVGLIERPRP